MILQRKSWKGLKNMEIDIKGLLLGLAGVIAEEAERNAGFRKKLEAEITKYVKTDPVTPGDHPLPPYFKENPIRQCAEGKADSVKKALNKLTVPQLKDVAAFYEVKLKGKKADNINTLMEFIEAEAQKPADTQPGQPEPDPAAEKKPGEGPDGLEPEGKAVDDNTDAAPPETVGTQEKPAETPPAENLAAKTVKPEEKAVPQPAADASKINPVILYRKEGEEKLREVLKELDINALHRIIKDKGLDTARKTFKWKDPERLKEFIIDRARARATQGDVFRNYKN